MSKYFNLTNIAALILLLIFFVYLIIADPLIGTVKSSLYSFARTYELVMVGLLIPCIFLAILTHLKVLRSQAVSVISLLNIFAAALFGLLVGIKFFFSSSGVKLSAYSGGGEIWVTAFLVESLLLLVVILTPLILMMSIVGNSIILYKGKKEIV